jgi:ribonuclease HI
MLGYTNGNKDYVCEHYEARVSRKQGRTMSVLAIYVDGGSRSNPGPSGLGIAGYHVDNHGNRECIFEKGIFHENCSNNLAEYLALIEGLNYALDSDYNNIEFYSDSKLIVEQVSGRWKVKCPDLKELSERAIARLNVLRKAGTQVTITWIPREKNVHADSLANLAMDRKTNAEYRRDVRQADKMQQHMEAMLAHEDLVKSIVEEPKRSKIRKLKESFDRVVETWSHLKM